MTPIEHVAQICQANLLEQLARPPAEAARLAHYAGGPSVAELERRIMALRTRHA